MHVDVYTSVMICFLLQLVLYNVHILYSAGVGRTDTFIAVDAMMQRLKDKDDLDIYSIASQIKTKQTFMVQNIVYMHAGLC